MESLPSSNGSTTLREFWPVQLFLSIYFYLVRVSSNLGPSSLLGLPDIIHLNFGLPMCFGAKQTRLEHKAYATGFCEAT
jgi:hypothetical protein